MTTNLEQISNAKDYRDLIEIGFQIFLSRNPIATTNMGLDLYNSKWPDVSLEGVNEDISILHSFQTKLLRFENSIGQEDQADFVFLIWLINYNLLELEELQYWKYNPKLSSLILSGINGILVKEQFNNKNRIQWIINRLDGIPDLINGIKSRVSHPVQLWIDSEIKSISRLPIFLETINDQLDFSNEEKINFQQKIANCIVHISSYQKWLTDLKGSKNVPIKPKFYTKLIELRQIGMSIEDIESLGKKYLDQTTEELNRLSEIIHGESIEKIRQQIRQKHASSYDEILEKYIELSNSARQFLINEDIITLPKEELQVVFTPPPMRHLLSIAAASPPGKFDKPQRGYFWLTPHENPKMMEEHSYAYQSLLINHESMPGHHIHGVCKNLHPSKARSSIFLNPSANSGLMYPAKIAEVTEGWGLYCEKMMYDHGFSHNLADPDLERKYLMINALRWRATRMIIDVNLHTGKMNYLQAVQFLQRMTGYNEETCKAEILMYSQSPGYFLSYLLGRHLILDLKKELGTDFPEKQFHDTIIYAGNVPFWFIKNHEFGIKD